ncbi:uncharacterized protein LOC123309787 [Coccinella septempunctata]|uniref:uncharacterized protein LOC123309787 n=1 Tax=Coccinella septempunctata TaxID=41139 RepID=UPI001D074D61|nr:uncharacterized protein LOC123309787 [Coccinella septempunctata]
MASSAMMGEKRIPNFTLSPIICRNLLPCIGSRELVTDSWDIRRHPSETHRYPFPSEYRSIETNRDFVSLEQGLSKTDKKLWKRRKNLVKEVKITLAKWKDLEDKEEILRKYFKKYNKFVLNGVEKRKRFLSMTIHQHEKVKQRSAEVEWLELELEKLKTVSLLLQQEISKHSIYDRYLEKVVDRSFRFKSVQDVTSSFEVLFESLDKTIAIYRKRVVDLEENHKMLDEMINNSRPMWLNLVLQYSRLTKAYDEVTLKNKENEKLIMSICSKTHEYAMDYEECIGNVNALYCTLCKRLDVKKKFPKYDYKNQLECIKSELGRRGKLK